MNLRFETNYELFRDTFGNFIIVIVSYLVAGFFSDKYSLWAPLTTLIVLQPTNGKSFYLGVQRLLGTIIGALIAIFLMDHIKGNLLFVIFSLTLILSISAFFASSNIKSVGSYIFQVAGLTSALLFLMSIFSSKNVGQVAHLRIVDTIIGVSVALIGLKFLTKKSSKINLDVEIKSVKNLALEWVEVSLKEGVNPENIRLRESLLGKINNLNDLGNQAFSEQFFLGTQKRKTTYYIGIFYTILSLHRKNLRALRDIGLEQRQQLEIKNFPEIYESFLLLDLPFKKVTLKHRFNLKAALIGFSRVFIAGILSGGLWYFTHLTSGATFFLTTLIYCSSLSTTHQPVDRIKRTVISVIASFFIVVSYFKLFEFYEALPWWHFIYLMLPGLILNFFKKFQSYVITIMIFTIIMYTTCVNSLVNLHYFTFLKIYIIYIFALILSLILNCLYYPQLAKNRLDESVHLLQEEFKKMTNLYNPIDSTWMFQMYNYIEDLIFYSKEMHLNESNIINKGLSVVDVCVEFLDLRSKIAFIEKKEKDEIATAINKLKNLSTPIETRLDNLRNLKNTIYKYDDICRVIDVIILKIESNKEMFINRPFYSLTEKQES